jgi:hypothetical protein
MIFRVANPAPNLRKEFVNGGYFALIPLVINEGVSYEQKTILRYARFGHCAVI